MAKAEITLLENKVDDLQKNSDRAVSEDRELGKVKSIYHELKEASDKLIQLK